MTDFAPEESWIEQSVTFKLKLCEDKAMVRVCVFCDEPVSVEQVYIMICNIVSVQ